MSAEALTMESVLAAVKDMPHRRFPIASFPHVIVHSAVRDINPEAFDRVAAEYQATTGRRVLVSEYLPPGVAVKIRGDIA